MEAKDLLQHYDNCVRRERRLESEILWERQAVKSLDLISGQMTRQMKDKLTNIEKNIRIYEEELVKVSDERQKIHDLISDISGVEGEVLTRRYIDGEIWEEICESMFYSLTMIHRIHNRALRMVQDRLDQGDIFDS